MHVQSKTELVCIKDLLQSEKVEDVETLSMASKKFIKQVKPMLKLFGFWFIVHWTLYALTTMLLSAFIVQIIIEVIKYKFNSVDRFMPNVEADTNAPYVLYVVFFTLVHAYLFLYPCFRAAAIASARIELIRAISRSNGKTFLYQFRTTLSSTSHQISSRFKYPCSVPISPLDLTGLCIFLHSHL